MAKQSFERPLTNNLDEAYVNQGAAPLSPDQVWRNERANFVGSYYAGDISTRNMPPYDPSATFTQNADRNDLIINSMRLVLNLGRTEVYPPTAGVERADRIQNGMLGHIRAIELYDPTMGLRYSTYAEPAIRRSIQRFDSGTPDINHGDLIRVSDPTYHVARRKLESLNYELNQELSSPEDVLNEASLSEEEQVAYNKYHIIHEPAHLVFSDEANHPVDDDPLRQPEEAMPQVFIEGGALYMLKTFVDNEIISEGESHAIIAKLGLETDGPKPSLVDLAESEGVAVSTIQHRYTKGLERIRAALVD